jgi:CDP-diacylglycerol---glycerol-3-phosphate 3-phosphatidyltransferase
MSAIKFNLPNIITFSRIGLIPFFVWLTPTNPALGAIIFSVAAISDILDGYLARKTGQITKFGIILDPIADKILVIAALILLVDMVRISSWIAMVIIVREFVVTGIRMVALSKDIVMSAETGGKLKAGAQMVSIILLLLPGGLGPVDFYDIGLVLMYIAVVLAVVSGVKYGISFWRRLQ